MRTLPTFELVIASGPRAGERITVTDAGITIGRQHDNTLALDDQELSRHHARVELQNAEPLITDLSSANGTTVNGQPLTGSRMLQPNDTIVLGSTELRVEWAGGNQPREAGAPSEPGATIPGRPAPLPGPIGPGPGIPVAQPVPPPLAPTPVGPASARSRLPLFLAGGVGVLVLCCVGALALVLLVSRGGSGGGTGSGGSGGGQSSPRTGYISGRVTDVQGKAIPGGVATIIMRGVTENGSNVDIRAQSDANGNYAQKVANGQYRLSSYLEITISGKKFSFELAPADNVDGINYDSTRGVVKDFQWRMSGKKPNTSDIGDPYFDCPNYYGGCAYFEHVDNITGGNAIAAKYPGAKIELILTPRGPLYDGSTGKVLTVPRDPKTQVYGRPALLDDIPLGAYTVTARIVEANGTAHPLQVAVGGKGTPTFGPSVNLDFTPSGSYGTGYASIVMSE